MENQEILLKKNVTYKGMDKVIHEFVEIFIKETMK